MKAIIFEKNVTPDKLVLREVETPIPAGDQVLIKIHAVSIVESRNVVPTEQ